MDDLTRILSIFTGVFAYLWSLLEWTVSTAWNSGVSPSIPAMIGLFLIFALWLASAFAAATIAELRERNRFLHMVLGLILPIIYPIAIHLLMPKSKYDKTSEEEEGKKEKKDEAPKPIKVPAKAPAQEQAEPEQESEEPEERNENPTDRQIPIPEEDEEEPDSSSDTLKMSRSSITQPNGKPFSGAEFDTSRTTRTPTTFRSLTSTTTIQKVVKDDKAPRPSKGSLPVFNQKQFASLATDAEGNSRGPYMIETTDGRFLEALRITGTLPDLIVVEMTAEGGKTRSVRLPYAKIRDCKLKSDWLGQ